MNTNTAQLTGSALVLAICAAVHGQSKPAPAAPAKSAASPTLVNAWLREQSPAFKSWDFGGEVRLRYEVFDNGPCFFAPNRDFQRTGVDNDNAYLLVREKIHLGYTPSTWLSLFVEGRDSSVTGDDDPKNPGADQFDLHQAYVALGDAKQFPITAKVGRQEMAFGEERLIGRSDWGNTGRVFDAAKLRYEDSKLWVDGFVSRVVVADNHNFNLPDDYDVFSGLYASAKSLVPWQETQVYFLSRNVGVGSTTAPRDIYTFGARVKSLPGKLKGWDYSAEVAGQLGSINSAGRRLEQQAMAATASGGYTWSKAFGAPRLSVEYNFSTGDSDRLDDESNTFDNLFPTNHKFYGQMDFVSWRNIHNPKFSAGFKPAKPLSVTLDYNLYWLADTHDSFYPQSGSGRSGNGYGKNPAYDSYVGSEINLEATYAVTRWAGLRAGYSHFFVGDYVKQSKAGVGGATDADWAYIQAVITF